MDIEPKDQESRHCSQYTGDMVDVFLEFYSASEGIYGQEEPRFYEHFFGFCVRRTKMVASLA